MSRCDVAVIGAGPYGLSAAAHLAGVEGLEVRAFGRPMAFWRACMPKGMCLESPHYASDLSDPGKALRLRDFYAGLGRAAEVSGAVSMERFAEYGDWFQARAVPFLETRLAVRVEAEAGGFRLRFDRGDSVLARRVVVAAGVAAFARLPDVFAGLPRELACHASQAAEPGRFSGRRVIVVGAGQSALETAALIREAGAQVELLVRQPFVRWRGGCPAAGGPAAPAAGRVRLDALARAVVHHRLVKPLLYSPLGIGPVGVSRVVAYPWLVRRLPRSLQDRFLAQCLRASASHGLAPRLREVTVSTGREVVEAREEGGGLRLRLSDGSERVVDHVVLATGYKTDLARYGFLPPELLARVRTEGGCPVLGPGLESSVPGLHFTGAPATYSFGALMHFVAGTPYTARSIARHVARAARVPAAAAADELRPAADWG